MPETIKEHVRRIHPGSGRRKGRPTPKGRQVDPQALDDVRALLGYLSAIALARRRRAMQQQPRPEHPEVVQSSGPLASSSLGKCVGKTALSVTAALGCRMD